MSPSEAPQQEESRAPIAAFEHVAVCVDYSDAAHDAIALGKALAGTQGRITLLHATEVTSQLGWVKMIAIPDLEWEPIGKDLLERLSKEVPDAEAVLLRGHPSTSVVRWVEQEHPDIVVCAAHHGVASRTLLGSVSSYLAYHLPCAVAIARAGIARPTRFTHIGACIDVDERADLVLDMAERIANAHLARVSAVHVMQDLQTYALHGWTPDPLAWRREWEEMLSELVGDRRCSEVLIDAKFAGSAVIDWATEAEVDLLVAAAHRRGLERWFLGGFASHLAHHALCDLVIGR
jgi:nucleotide-binding universal stress UspA family protein